MPARDRDRVTFDTLECSWLISALTVARDALQAKAENPSIANSEAHDHEQLSIRLDMLLDEVTELVEAAYREAAQTFTEDFSKRRNQDP